MQPRVWTPDLGTERVEPLLILAIAPHPDDAELGVGGILALHARAGDRVGVLDLTRGEMATNGTPDERLKEAGAASRVLGLTWRGNLKLPDSRLTDTVDHATAIAGVLRMVRPVLVLAPDAGDRHPDHRAAAALTRRATFLASLGQAGIDGVPLASPSIAHYAINDRIDAGIVVDVTDVYDVKRQAIAAHASQFSAHGRKPTVLNDPSFLAMIESRDAHHGAVVGTGFGEGLAFAGPLVVSGLRAVLSPRRGREG